MLDRIRGHLGECARPQFAQLVIWALTYIAMARTQPALVSTVGERAWPVTVLSFLPEGALVSPHAFAACRWVLLIAGTAWVFQLMLPWSSWLTAMSFTALVALVYENSSGISHTFNLANIVLIIHAAWVHFHRQEIKAALNTGAFWRTPSYPRWVFYLSVFCLALYHTYAGFSKLAESGVQWVNGVSLQLWLHLWGREGSILRDLILSNRNVAMLFQASTLVIETGTFLVIFSLRLRWLFGVALLGMYVGIIESFGYHFWYNFFLVAVFFLPVQQAVERVYERLHRTARIPVRFPQGRVSGTACRFLLRRFDVFDVFVESNDSTPKSFPE